MGAYILIVVYSGSFRQSVRFILEQSGYTVFEAADGMEGLKRLSEQKIQLVVTDVNMPNMDGLTGSYDRIAGIGRRGRQKSRRDGLDRETVQ